MPTIPSFDVPSKICAAPHIVILGAGASHAALPDGDANGRTLPVMNSLVDTVGLGDLVAPRQRGENFERIYSEVLAEDAGRAREMEQRIEAYFSAIQLPDAPTTYDYLLLSLREKDIVATFNWDPLLAQAYVRNIDTARGRLPKIVFLHGNVAVGQCLAHKQKGFRLSGLHSAICPICQRELRPTPLLYPISQKNYQMDSFIANEWNELAEEMRHGYLLTIFGYSAPVSDVEAKRIIQSAWSDNQTTEFALIHIVDLADRRDLKKKWQSIDCYRGVSIYRDLRETYLLHHPRRSCEATFMAMMQQSPVPENPIPHCKTLAELRDWVEPILLEEQLKKFWA